MTTHIHFDPVGGVAGDMFVAAMLDTFPHLLTPCLADLQASGVLEHVEVALESGKSQSLAVQRFKVKNTGDQPRATGHYKDLVVLLESSELDKRVLKRALDLFLILGTAESRVHGVELENVHFHEVADWDSVTDIVAAASVIERCEVDAWSCGALPVGSGFVDTEHGSLPVPAPATLALLEDLPSWDDGESGERVTPTGAAIIRYLLKQISFAANTTIRPVGRICTSGMGAGQRALDRKPNVLRCTLLDCEEMSTADNSSRHNHSVSLAVADFDHEIDQVAQLTFAIDDMSSEELAVALQFIRQSDGVFDVSHQMSFGKKGRIMFDVIVLCATSVEPVIARQCFTETSTLGLRVQFITRRILKREQFTVPHETGEAGIKQVIRPSDVRGHDAGQHQHSLKVESNDLRRVAGLYARRQRAAELSAQAVCDPIKAEVTAETIANTTVEDNPSASADKSTDSTRYV